MKNYKKIKRDERLEIRLTKKEKEIITNYAKDLEMNASRLVRNITLLEIESIINKMYLKPLGKKYIQYLKLTKNLDELERLKTP